MHSAQSASGVVTPTARGELSATPSYPATGIDPLNLVFPRVIDATMRSDWWKCPHAFFRRHLQGLVRPRINVHLHFGSCMAKGLEAARREYHTSSDTNDALIAGCETLIQSWGDFPEPTNPSRSEAAKTLQGGLHALQHYFAEWPLDDDMLQIHTHNGAPCIEWSGAWPIPGSRHPDTSEPILYAGRFDLIADFQRATWGLDDKTTSIDPNHDSWRNQWRLRGQFTGYTWLAHNFGIPLKGFIVRGIGVQKTDIKLGYAIVPRPPWMVERWLRQLQDDTHEMCQQYSNLIQRFEGFDEAPYAGHPFPQAFDYACADFGGCTYLDLCTSEHPEDWTDQFEVQRWDPLVRAEDSAA